jgi:SAM-dependent MidA family methyltransferase
MEQLLESVLQKRIEQHGPMPFIDFMAACLYEPGQGYYTSPGRKVGVAGDFYTSISVHAAFGRVLAREITAMWHSLHCPSQFTLMEVGAGHGRLACDILDYLAECQPACYQTVALILVDQEPTLIEAQQTTLKSHIAIKIFGL